jgi:hypothetical protein
MKIFFFVIVLILFITDCSKQSSHKVVQEADSTIRQIENELDTIYSAADSGESWAILELYDILQNGESAEESEMADIELTELLYYKTDNWIDAFSQLSDSAQIIFKNNYHWAYIGEVDFVNDSTMTQKRFREAILDNLKKIRGESRKRELAEYFINLFHSAIKEDSIKNSYRPPNQALKLTE